MERKCLVCPALVPENLKNEDMKNGRRGSIRRWYSNGFVELVGAVPRDIVRFYLCPLHNKDECHDQAWAWAKEQVEVKSVATVND